MSPLKKDSILKLNSLRKLNKNSILTNKKNKSTVHARICSTAAHKAYLNVPTLPVSLEGGVW